MYVISLMVCITVGKGSLATHTAVTWEELESEMSSVTSNPEVWVSLCGVRITNLYVDVVPLDE